MKIKLYNRDGADLWLEKTDKEIESNIYVWKLTVDDEHRYVLRYCRYIYENGFDSNIISVDPSGGPYLSLGDEFENKYKIVQINSTKNIWISERNNDN